VPTITLKHHNRQFDLEEEARDLNSDEAIQRARAFGLEGWTFDVAYLDREGGMIMNGPMGWQHFRNATCGYGGVGVQASAEILAMFDFGDYDELFERIRFGGDTAHFVIYR